MSRAPEEQLLHFVSDLYSMELQAIAQLETAPKMAGDPGVGEDFHAHLSETKQQAEMIRERLDDLGGSPSTVKDAIMKLGGKGFLLFANLQPETPGRLVAHSYSYEAMEWAGYAMLIRMAELAGDEKTAEVGRAIQAQERSMMLRLEKAFGPVENAAHHDLSPDKLSEHLRNHLNEAHALEAQGIKLLEKSADIAGDPELDDIYSKHLKRTRVLNELVERRLNDLGAKPSAFKDAAMKLGGLNWGLFFQAQSDTPAKLTAFVYAVYHLKIAGHELLQRTARRAGDTETEEICKRIIAEERSMADELEQRAVDISVQATYHAVQQ